MHTNTSAQMLYATLYTAPQVVLCWCVFQLVWLAAPASMYVHTYLAERRVNGGPPVTLVGRIRLNIVPHLRYKEEG